MTATVFAREKGISYPTVIRWLDRKLVPGAELKESPERGKWWEIPESALAMEPPKPGPKKGSKRATDGEVSTATDAPDDAMPAAVTGKPKKTAGKKARRKGGDQ